jgi:hypothetical protein
MNKKFIIVVLFIFSCASLLNAQLLKPALLQDGLVLKNAAGKLIGPDDNDACFFELSSTINEDSIVVESGSKFELLPSAALEKMIADSKTHLSATYQLWNARITKYKGKNYIFPSIFIQVSPPSEPQLLDRGYNENSKPAEVSSAGSTPKSSASIDVNDSLSLPPEVIERLNNARNNFIRTGQRIPDANIVTIDEVQQELEKKRQPNPDTVLLDKSAILVNHGMGKFDFNLDSIGRNIDQTSLRLLPCEALEQTQSRQSASPEPLRFKISGVVTKYKGKNYLLLYKAAQTYSYGNFAK